MKKRILCLIMTMAMVFSVLVFVPAATMTAVADTYKASDNPVLISTTADMKAFRDAVNAGNTFEGKVVKLCADIDISDAGWTPIGRNGYQFRGSFDGQGHTITGMTQTYSRFTGDGGLFGYVQAPSGGGSIYIKNFKLTRKGSEWIQSSNGGYSAGTVISIIAPYPGKTGTVNVQNVYSSVYFDSSNALLIGAGGIVGNVVYNYGSTDGSDDSSTIDGSLTVNIDSCQFDGLLGSPSAGSKRIGGILGYTGGVYFNKTINITNCSVTGEIHIWGTGALSNYDSNGGILGYLNGARGTSGKTVNVNVSNNIFAGTMLWRKDSKQTGGVGDQGYIMGDFTSGKLGTVVFKNNYYVPTTPQGGLTVTAGFGTSTSAATTVTNNVSKTMAELKAMTSGFEDNTKWHFGSSSELLVPDTIWDLYTDSLTSTIGSYYLNDTVSVDTAAKLLAVATRSKQTNRTFSGKTVSITADIDLSGSSWSGLGNGNGGYPFMGNFYGNNHTINYAQTLSNTDGDGGLINLLRTPNGGTVTVKDLKVTGTITSTSTNSAGYYGTVVSMVDAGTAGSSGATGTINISNVWSTVNVNQSGTIYAVGGIVAYVRHAVSTPLTLNIDSCVYSGTLNFGNQAAYCGGILGYSGHNGGTRNVNITNCLVDGQISLNDIYSNGIGLIVGRVNGTSGWYGTVTYNIKDCIATGKFTFYTKDSRVWDINKDYGMVVGATYNASGTYQTTNITNVYYQLRSNTLLIPAYGAANHARLTATDTNCCVEGNFTALTAANCGFTTPSKWKFTANTNSTEYYPVPASIYTSFGKSITRSTYAHMTVSQETGYKSGSVRFTATFYNTAGSLGITNIGSNNVNCGVILVPLSSYSTSSTDTVAGLTSLTKAKQVKAFKFTEPSSGVYQVDVVLCNYSNNSGKQGNDYMAYMYYGSTVISGCIISYNRLSAGHI